MTGSLFARRGRAAARRRRARVLGARRPYRRLFAAACRAWARPRGELVTRACSVCPCPDILPCTAPEKSGLSGYWVLCLCLPQPAALGCVLLTRACSVCLTSSVSPPQAHLTCACSVAPASSHLSQRRKRATVDHVSVPALSHLLYLTCSPRRVCHTRSFAPDLPHPTSAPALSRPTFLTRSPHDQIPSL